jgi:hypothetical protein
MVSYLYTSPSGIPGDVTRVDDTNIEPVTLVSPFPTNYGLPMKYVAGGGTLPTGVTPMVAADAAAVFCGVLTRQAPAISGSNTNESFYTDEPNSLQIQGLCVRGYVTVQVNAGTPVRGTVVGFVQTASAGHPAGVFEVATTGNNVPLSGTLVGDVTWAADGVDVNGFGEIRIAQ